MLLSLLVLPLYIPTLIFGAGAVQAHRAGLGAGGHLSLLGALLALALVLRAVGDHGRPEDFAGMSHRMVNLVQALQPVSFYPRGRA